MFTPGEVGWFVWSGGGINGYAHIGVWRFLEEVWMANGLSLTKSVKGTAGTSIGAIVALALALGFTSHELEAFATTALEGEAGVAKINLRGLIDGTAHGLISHRIISDFVKRMLDLKTGQPELTFGELKDHCAVEYVCTAHNITELRSEYFGTEHTPDVPVWVGVTMSCLLPILFDSMKLNNCEYYDGGLSNSMPIEVFPLQHTVASQILRKPGGKITSMLGRFSRITESCETATKEKVERIGHELAALIKVFVPVSTSEHVITTGELRVNSLHKEQLLTIGRDAAVQTLSPDLWVIVRALQTILRPEQ